MEQQTPTEQAPAPSVQDRIASIFGGESQEAPPEKQQARDEPTQTEETQAASEPEEASTAPETFELEIDGEKFTLPKKLEKAVLQEKDYTQKSQTLADQRRQIEIQQQQARVSALTAQFHKATETEQQQLQMLDTLLHQAKSQDVSGWEIDRLIKHRFDIDALNEKRADLEKAIDGKRQEYGQKQAQEIAKLRAESLDAIKKRIPGWSEQTAKDIREHARSEGYSDAELDAILDPRHAITLWKAQQFDKLKSSATKTVADAKNLKTTSTNPMPQQVKDKFAYQKALQKTQRGSQEHQRVVKDRIAKLFG